METRPSLASLVGHEVAARILSIDEKQVVVVKLLAVESGGIWVESKTITEDFLAGMGVAPAPPTFVLFVPYHYVPWIVSVADYPFFSGKILPKQDDSPRRH
jgi:hypothetical protein